MRGFPLSATIASVSPSSNAPNQIQLEIADGYQCAMRKRAKVAVYCRLRRRHDGLPCPWLQHTIPWVTYAREVERFRWMSYTSHPFLITHPYARHLRLDKCRMFSLISNGPFQKIECTSNRSPCSPPLSTCRLLVARPELLLRFTSQRDPETGKMTRMFAMTGRAVHVATNSALKVREMGHKSCKIPLH